MNSENCGEVKSFKGIIRGTRSRYGFLSVENHKDIFVKPQEMDKVFAGDIVEVDVYNYNTDKQELIIKKIIESEFKKCIGLFSEDQTGAYVLPEDYGFNRKIRIPNSFKKRAKNDQFVKIEIIEHPFETKKPKAKVIDVINDVDAIGFEIDYFISKYDLSNKLSKKIKEESDFLIDKFKNLNINQYSKRKNLTKLNFLTIDGDNTIDIDDAVYVQKLKNKWKLLVAISDVSEFIEEDSYIDKEAYKRISTVYIPGRTIPMLPSDLAHDYFSLKPLEKKMVLIFDATLSSDFNIEKYEFYEGIIESKAKLTYNEVESYFETGSILPEHEFLKNELNVLEKLFIGLNKRRSDYNIIPAKRNDFKFVLNDCKKIDYIERIEMKRSHKIIEEIMFLANKCAADFINDFVKNKKRKGLFKIQKGIDNKSIYSLYSFLNNYININIEDFNTLDGFKSIYKKIENTENPEHLKEIIHLNMVDSEFSEFMGSHYTMGFKGYTYFTSPIRRYSDIIVHRIIKSKINKKHYSISKRKYIDHLNKKTIDIQNCIKDIESSLVSEYLLNNKNVVFKASVININDYCIKVKLNINGIVGFIYRENNSFDNINLLDVIDVKIDLIKNNNELIFKII